MLYILNEIGQELRGEHGPAGMTIPATVIVIFLMAWMKPGADQTNYKGPKRLWVELI